MRMKAFPTLKDNGHITTQDGMDLRDYFAAAALQGLIAGCFSGNNAGFTVDGNVYAAYEYADAMMEARKND
jgi:hypothetical protein